MATKVIDEARVTVHCDVPVRDGRYVLYWMQASVRTRDNHALEYAVQVANDAQLPLVVCFGLDADYADATPRTMRFLVDGLVDVAGGSRPSQHRLRSSDRHPVTWLVRSQQTPPQW